MEYWPTNTTIGAAGGSAVAVTRPDLSALLVITASAEVVTSLETLQRLRQLADQSNASDGPGRGCVPASDILRVLNGDLS